MSRTWKWFAGISLALGLGGFLYWSGFFDLEAPRYKIVELGTLGGEMSVAYAINDRGEVVGQSDNAEGEKHAFIWDATRGMRAIPGITRKESRAMDINNKGQVVGSESDPLNPRQPGRSRTGQSRPTFSKGTSSPGPPVGDGYGGNRDRIQFSVPHSFVWSELEGRIDLAHPSYAGCSASAINNKGGIIGGLANESGGMIDAVWLSPEEVKAASAYGVFRITGMNERGQFAGTSAANPVPSAGSGRISAAAFYDGMKTHLIEETKGLNSLRIRDLNDTGKVLGRYSAGSRDHIFVWSATTGLVNLTSSRSLFLDPEALNNEGQVIGSASTIYFTEQLENLGITWRWVLNLAQKFDSEEYNYPFLWDGGVLIDLNGTVPTESGWERIDEVTDINDHGWIVGNGVFDSSTRALLLVPKEE